jgi:hypothetical protein
MKHLYIGAVMPPEGREKIDLHPAIRWKYG